MYYLYILQPESGMLVISDWLIDVLVHDLSIRIRRYQLTLLLNFGVVTPNEVFVFN